MQEKLNNFPERPYPKGRRNPHLDNRIEFKAFTLNKLLRFTAKLRT
jgi:hypothetical protein